MVVFFTVCPWLLSVAMTQHSVRGSWCHSSWMLSGPVALNAIFNAAIWGTRISRARDTVPIVPDTILGITQTLSTSPRIPLSNTTPDHRLRVSMGYLHFAVSVTSLVAILVELIRVFSLQLEHGCAQCS